MITPRTSARKKTGEARNTVPEFDTHLKGNFYDVFRGITLHGYYTSEIGFTQELKLQIIPGAHMAARSWAPDSETHRTGDKTNMAGGNTYDAVIVGSGITGGWAAKELTEKGLSVLVLEAGRTILPERDYVEHVPVWELKVSRLGQTCGTRKHAADSARVLLRLRRVFEQVFRQRQGNPYSTDPNKKFSWIRGRQVGGKSLTWGRQSYRWSDLDFEANLRDGVAVDWPIRYADIAPWYDYVEEFAGISGQAEGLPQLPDGKFLPPMEMTCVERDVRDALAKKFDDRMMTIGRSAVLTQVHKGRAACHYCGVCHRGCITGSYFSSLSSTLPAAQKNRATHASPLQRGAQPGL